MAAPVGRGAQVRLDGEQQRLARGASAASLYATMEAKRLLEAGGAVSTGYTPDGSSPLGVPPEDELLAPAGSEAPEATVPLADLVALAARVTDLEARCAALRARVDALEARYG